MRNFAKRLIIHETSGMKFSDSRIQVAFHVCEKLRPHLATLMGNVGFRALLSRALALANAEVLWLRAVHVRSDGALEGLEELHAQLDPAKLTEGGVVLLAQLLGLLSAFIGDNLTLGLVREVWSTVPLHDLDLGHGGKNEETK
jgi:hypothetical protein